MDLHVSVLTIGQIAKAAGVTTPTVRYYEEIGNQRQLAVADELFAPDFRLLSPIYRDPRRTGRDAVMVSGRRHDRVHRNIVSRRV